MNLLIFFHINKWPRICSFIRNFNGDLKSENLLLSNDDILKIIEFNSRNYFKENKEPLLVTPCG